MGRLSVAVVGIAVAGAALGCGLEYTCLSDGPTASVRYVTVEAGAPVHCPDGYECDSGFPCLPGSTCEVFETTPGACGDAGVPDGGLACQSVYVENHSQRLCDYR